VAVVAAGAEAALVAAAMAAGIANAQSEIGAMLE
jgi:hypothetical protein